MKATVQKRNAEENAVREDYIAPEVNIYETREAYVLQAEMPGVCKSGLEVTLDGNEITITGHRNGEKDHGQPLLRERRRAGFRRVFELDPMIETGKIAARMEQGVLTLTLPKSEKVKPRKIEVA